MAGKSATPPQEGATEGGPQAPSLEVDLVKRGVAGDADAFEELVHRHANAMVRFACHMVGDFQAAEDIAQEAFLKAFSHLGRLDDPAKFATWLYSITRHCCLDWLRTKRPAVSVEGLEDDGILVADASASAPPESIEKDELHGRVLEELRKLRSDYREILLLKHVYELSYKEIGEMAGLSVSAVGEKLCRVRQMLRERLRRRVGR